MYSPGGGGRQTPRVAEQTPGTLPSNATNTPLPSPSPIQTTSPLSPETVSPSNTVTTIPTGSNGPSSSTDIQDSTTSTSAKPSEKANDQAVHVVQFNTTDSSKHTQATVKTGTLTLHPEKNPVREGFRFDGWTLDGQPFDFQTPILQDITLTAKWAKTTDWTLSPDHGPATGAQLTISPPDRQKPYYVSVQAAGQQLVGLTGDGYIYTWTQDSTPKQVPAPAQAAEGFRYLQAAAGNHWQAALGSDQRIYTRTSQQSMPTILDTGQDTRFTSISINDDRLLTVDRQGQAHTFQAIQAGSQNQNPQLIQQAATSLPGNAQAVTAVASGSRILIVDADRQAWTWDTADTGNAKPARVKQDPDMRIVQAQALSRGFLLLDTDGQAWYLSNSTASMTSVGLPDGAKASQITANKDQAMITDKDGRIWAWKPGETPIRADNGSQQYMQAAKVGNRITAISRQGNMFTWSPDSQGKPGKPARLDTGTAPTLESASMDGQPLKLTRSNDSWQADIPARNPGPAAILITGRQDGQPFTRSITYTVDQTLTRDAEPRSTLTVRFDTCGGNPEPADQNFSTMYGRVKRPSPNPAREGFLFDGWFTGQVAYDFSRPVTKDLTLTARWSPANRNTKWSISPDKGSQLGGESTTITPPPDSTKRGIRFSQVSGGEDDDHGFSLAVGSDGNAYAWGDNTYGRLGDGTTTDRYTPVIVKQPDRQTYPDLPKDFTYVQVSAGYDFSLALGSDGNAYAWGNNNDGRLGDGTTTSGSKANPVPVPVVFPLTPVITGVRFDQTAASGLTRGDGNSVSVLTPAHQPGTVTVSVDYTIGGSAQQPDTSLKYTYLSAGMLPQAGGEGILLALATGTISMGGVLASRRHRRETHRLLYASHE
nr:InlB B-repeat-containing protein [Bifidobacterium polysaccharolyticum]